jgi:hypothetical protein
MSFSHGFKQGRRQVARCVGLFIDGASSPNDRMLIHGDDGIPSPVSILLGAESPASAASRDEAHERTGTPRHGYLWNAA